MIFKMRFFPPTLETTVSRANEFDIYISSSVLLKAEFEREIHAQGV